jgi:hypothetical protein
LGRFDCRTTFFPHQGNAVDHSPSAIPTFRVTKPLHNAMGTESCDNSVHVPSRQVWNFGIVFMLLPARVFVSHPTSEGKKSGGNFRSLPQPYLGMKPLQIGGNEAADTPRIPCNGVARAGIIFVGSQGLYCNLHHDYSGYCGVGPYRPDVRSQDCIKSNVDSRTSFVYSNSPTVPKAALYAFGVRSQREISFKRAGAWREIIPLFTPRSFERQNLVSFPLSFSSE